LESPTNAEKSIGQISESIRKGTLMIVEKDLNESVHRIKFLDCVPPALRQSMIRVREVRLGDCETIARQPVSRVRCADHFP